MSVKLKKPSFRRLIVKREFVEKVTVSEPKIKESKYRRVEVSIQTKTSSFMIFLSCGHSFYAGNLNRDKLKSMDCYYCQKDWEKENNCDWQGFVHGT